MTLTWAKQIFEAPSGRLVAHVVEQGSRRVLLLHGNSSSMDAFASQIAALQNAGYSVLAPDLPGHGQSENAIAPENTYSFPGYARAIGHIVDQLRWPAYSILGWSLGGHIALELMSSDPRVEGLLIVGTPPVKPEPAALHEAFFATGDMELAGKEEFTEDDARTYLGQMLGCGPELPQHLLAAARRTDGRARAWMIANGMAGIGADARQLVAEAEQPLAVLHGAMEPFVRLSYLEGLTYRNLWRKSVQVFERDGHAPHWTNPAEFNKLMLEFFADADASSQGR